MSVTRETTIWCDGKDEVTGACGEWVQDADTAANIRARLRRRGWTQKGSRDLCRYCTAKESA